MSSEMEVVHRGEIVRTVDVIAAEINALTATMLSNVIEIGRRMVEAKDLLPHGQFGPWLKENTGYSQSTASNYMRLFKEYGNPQKSLFGAEINCQTFGNLNYSKALALLELPAGEREEFVKTNDVEGMSTRELQKAIAERDAAIRERDEALQAGEGTALAMGELEDKLAAVQEARDTAAAALEEREEEVLDLKRRVRELEERPVEVAVQEPDPAEVAKAVEAALAQAAEAHRTELAGLQAKLDKEVAENNKLEKRLAKAKEAAAAASDIGEQARLSAEVDRLTKELAMAAPEITTFKVQFSAWQQTYSQMMRTLAAVPGGAADNLRRAVAAQIAEWGRV